MSTITAVPPLLLSLATLLRLRGKVIPVSFLRSRLGGVVTPQACLRAATEAGLQGSLAARPSLQSLSVLAFPCVLLLQGDTSCVLVELGESEAVVILPEHGETPSRIKREDLETAYTGYVIFGTVKSTLDNRTRMPFMAKGKHWFRDVLAYYAPIYRHTVMASIVINCIAVFSPLFVMNVYDRVVPNKALETLWALTIAIGVAYIFDALLRVLRSYFVDTAGRNADVVISSLLLDKVLNMRMDAKPESTGALVNNLREFESLREFISSSTLLACVDMPFLLLFLFLIGYIGGPIVVLPMVAIPLLVIAGLWFQNRAKQVTQRQYRHNMHKNALLVEMVQGLETIKACQAEGKMQRLWESVCGLSAQESAKIKHYSSLAVTFATFVTHVVTVGMTVWGVYRIAGNSLTMGGLIASNILVGRAMAPVMQMAQLLTRFQHSRVSYKTLDSIMQFPSEHAGIDSMDFGNLEHSFTLENVNFTYPGADRSALEDCSLTIHQGEKVGIIGPMGSGKSTLAKLMLGLYTPQKGSVCFGGVDIRQLECSELRSHMGYLPQEVTLLYGTIRDNIQMGDSMLDDAALMQAAEVAGVTSFIRQFSAGFGAQVGEQGRALSGGQRQAVALARTLVRNPDILVLDEPTSNMDIHSEKRVQEQLADFLADKTFVCISHRPQMLQVIDRLVVMEHGHVVLDGPRDAVMQEIGLIPAPAPKVEVSQPISISGSVADVLRKSLRPADGQTGEV